MKTILITGINGFLGSHLAKTLQEEYNIIGLEHYSSNMFRIKDNNFKVYSSQDNYEEIFIVNTIFAIIHTATIYRRKGEPLEDLINTNVLLPVKLFELANKYECKLFLNTDSFFNNPKYNYSFLPEYTLSKKQILEWLKLIEDSCKLVNMQVFHMYGPNDAPLKFIPSIIKRLKKNEPFIETTKGEQTRDFIYIKDVISAYKCILDSYRVNNFTINEFQIGTGISTSVKDFLLMAKEIIGSKTVFKFGALPYRNNEIMESKADLSALKRMNWVAKYSVKDGIVDLIRNDRFYK